MYNSITLEQDLDAQKLQAIRLGCAIGRLFTHPSLIIEFDDPFYRRN